MSWDYGYYRFYESAKPIEVEDGIRAQSRRGDIGATWWSKKWIDSLKKNEYDNRLSRGRSYARKGQVVSLKIEKGTVTAKVQGTRSTPYKISINLSAISTAKWKKVCKAMAGRIYYAAALFSKEMPHDIEDVFLEVGVSLFPKSGRSLKTECSCPDWANPCKHIAAVCYLIAEELDRDPFLIFKMRGLERDEFFEMMEVEFAKGYRNKKRKGSKKAGDSDCCKNPFITLSKRKEIESETPAKNGRGSEESEEPGTTHSYNDHPDDPTSSSLFQVTPDPEQFWNGKEEGVSCSSCKLFMPPVNCALPKRLGRFPFWRGKQPFLPTLETIYKRATEEILRSVSQ